MATFRGQDGSFSLATNVVGEVRSWQVNGELAALEDTVLGDKHRTFKGGLGGGSGSCTCYFDYGDTNGQKVLVDEIAAATPDGAQADIRFRLSATKYLSGAAVITGFTINTELENVIEVTFNFVISGGLSITWS